MNRGEVHRVMVVSSFSPLHISSIGSADAAKQIRLRDAFTQAQMATMYDRFGREDVLAAPGHVQAAHAMATAAKHVGDKRPVPPTVAKLQSMTVAVCGFNWQEFVAKYTESFVQERS